MDLNHLIAALSDPAAYPYPVDAVEVRQTHISVVFLAGPYAYKIKKPVALGFLDYSTLEKRRHFCEQELRLNRRLAPTVYLGVVAVTGDETAKQVRIESPRPEPAIEWAVKMERLPEGATLKEQLRREAIGREHIERLAGRIAAFHARAASGPEISAYGRFAVVAGNARENFAQAAAHVGTTLSRTVFDRLQSLTEDALAALRPLIEERADRHVPRDGHGDLRLDHVYLFADRPPPADLVVVDGIEFNERFRCGDPIADLAFLVMDLTFHGRPDLVRVLAEAYLAAANDADGRSLLPFYHSYRAAVRGKVKGMVLDQPEIPQAERSAALDSARAHWLLALGALEAPERRPCLLLVGGLPGVGKSSLARALAARAGFTMIRSDEVRKELSGTTAGTEASATSTSGAGGFEQGIYTPQWTERTYAECLRRAEALLFEGRRVLVDASFSAEANRRRFLDAAARWSVPGLLLVCRAEPAVVKARLAARHDDPSDADWSVYQKAAAQWEEPGPRTERALYWIDSGHSLEHALAQACAVLDRELGAGQCPPG